MYCSSSWKSLSTIWDITLGVPTFPFEANSEAFCKFFEAIVEFRIAMSLFLLELTVSLVLTFFNVLLRAKFNIRPVGWPLKPISRDML